MWTEGIVRYGRGWVALVGGGGWPSSVIASQCGHWGTEITFWGGAPLGLGRLWEGAVLGRWGDMGALWHCGGGRGGARL